MELQISYWLHNVHISMSLLQHRIPINIDRSKNFHCFPRKHYAYMLHTVICFPWLNQRDRIFHILEWLWTWFYISSLDDTCNYFIIKLRRKAISLAACCTTVTTSVFRGERWMGMTAVESFESRSIWGKRNKGLISRCIRRNIFKTCSNYKAVIW